MRINFTNLTFSACSRNFQMHGFPKKNSSLFANLALSIAFLLSAVSFSSGQTNVACNNNGTLANGSDDYVTFQLNATPPTPYFEAPYTYMMTASQGGAPVTVTLADGTPATAVPFGIISPFRTANGTAGQGNIILTVTPNFGSSAPVNYTVTDPGVCTLPDLCVPGQKTASYKYRSPVTTSDAYNWNTYIPKFNPNSEQTLTSVDLILKGDILNTSIIENGSVPPLGQTATIFTIDLSSNLYFNLNGSSIPLTNNIGSIINTTVAIPGQVSVPAQGSWTGDVTGSTLRGMAQASSDWLLDKAFAYLDPTADPRWVTNLTGNNTHDDDMFLSIGNHRTASNTVSYNAPSDLTLFTGASGNVPLTFSTLTSQGGGGGGGNDTRIMSTLTFFEIDLTYTYNETCTSLPVKLKSFSGKQAEETVALNWDVAEEMNVSHYDVEQSVDAKVFRTVSTVPASGEDHYATADNNPVSGKSYYRLKSVDLDGTYAYSRTISVDFSGNNFVKVFPNPTSELLSIETENISNIERIEILKTNGTIIQSLGGQDIKEGISIKSLPSGAYVVRIISINGEERTKSFVVSKIVDESQL